MMNIVADLADPLNTIVIENKVGSYKHFQTSDSYPIEGVNFYANYGYLPGYTGEDGVDLDFFVGSNSGGKTGYFLVWRSDSVPTEHKYFVAMSDDELNKTLKEYGPVLVGSVQYLEDHESLVTSIKQFKDME